jgi:hypothetical protein
LYPFFPTDKQPRHLLRRASRRFTNKDHLFVEALKYSVRSALGRRRRLDNSGDDPMTELNLWFNGNGPNVPALECARIQLRYEFPRYRFRVLSLFDCSARVQEHYFSDAADVHANRGETSLLMHLRPAAVRPDAAVDEEDVTPGKIFSYDMPSTTATGVVGRPRLASPQDGAKLTQMLVDDLSAIVQAALIEPWPSPPGGG